MEVIINKENNEVTARLIGRLDTPASQDIAPDVQSLIEEAGKAGTFKPLTSNGQAAGAAPAGDDGAKTKPQQEKTP